MYITVVYSSPREYGYSRRAAEVLSEFFREEGFETLVYNVFYKKIEPCLACVSDDVKLCKFPCVIEDDAREIFYAIDKSSGLVIVSPIYWYGVPGPLKNLIDRMTVFENEIFISGRSRLEGKVVGLVVIGNDTGSIAVIQNLMAVMNSMGAVIPPWALAYYTGREDPFSDESFLLDLVNVARSVSMMVRILASSGGDRAAWYNASREMLERARRIYERVRERVESERRPRGAERLRSTIYPSQRHI